LVTTRTALLARTRKFGIDVIRLCGTLQSRLEGRIIAGQLIRSATSVGANYRSACRARSTADFVAKLALVEEESDESLYWLEMVSELYPGREIELRRLTDEANQLVAIASASRKTARKRLYGSKGIEDRKSKIEDND